MSRSWGLILPSLAFTVRALPALAVPALVMTSPARAQDGALTAEQAIENARKVWSIHADTREQLPACADTDDPDVIVVCAETVAPEEVMSVIPPPVDADGGAPRAPEMAENCVRTRGRANCIMFGNVPEYPPLIDMSAFPEPLSDADAAAVTRAD